MINDLDTLKQHLRVSSSDEDTLIGMYADAAEEWIANYLGETPHARPSIKAAHLLLVGGLYENRQSQTMGVEIKENPAVTSLLFPFRTNLGV